jgi:hypothetical protein
MKYLLNFAAWMLILSGLPMAAQQSQPAQVTQPLPADIRIGHDVHVENGPLLGIFKDILRGTGIYGGFVDTTNCEDQPKGHHLQIETGMTVQQAMDALVAANPGYRWQMSDGVVNLMPQNPSPLLLTRIPKFEIKATDREIPAVLNELLRLPAVLAREAALGIKDGPVSGVGLSSSGPVPKPPVPIEINLRNVSLLEAFNKIIVHAPPGAMWISGEGLCGGQKSFGIHVAENY